MLFVGVDVNATEIFTYSVAVALVALVPILTTLAIVAIQAYGKIREAWVLVQSNNMALHQQVLPQLASLRAEGETQHAETIAVINGNGGSSAAPRGTITG